MCPNRSRTGIGLSLTRMFHSSCQAAMPMQPILHQPKQNPADNGTAKSKSSQPNPGPSPARTPCTMIKVNCQNHRIRSENIESEAMTVQKEDDDIRFAATTAAAPTQWTDECANGHARKGTTLGYRLPNDVGQRQTFAQSNSNSAPMGVPQKCTILWIIRERGRETRRPRELFVRQLSNQTGAYNKQSVIDLYIIYFTIILSIDNAVEFHYTENVRHSVSIFYLAPIRVKWSKISA